MADLKNIGNGPYGGAITAALYLNEFVEPPPADEAEVTDDVPPPAPPAWLHLDMMAYNTGARPGRPEGGEAMGMRNPSPSPSPSPNRNPNRNPNPNPNQMRLHCNQQRQLRHDEAG